ncbi:hypothetical protein [Pelagimonas varians]|uniref:hypothetical protein n=1 Tax=Pelagimonas varians TaxID=696760 RepID=UPI00147311B4
MAKGGLIGYSGNTGQTAGPHLHSTVATAGKDARAKTLRVTFRTDSGRQICPRKGQKLRAIDVN